ncbi:MAG: phage holin family protein [Gammaproteobacteria bacterium]|nr:phage holin family protein [Gammaproteobacteria bacterium]
MTWVPPVTNGSHYEPLPHIQSASRGVNPLDAIRILRSAGGALIGQISLYGQLAEVEWAEEKERLFKMGLILLGGLACLLCAMLFVGVVVLMLSWNTEYRLIAGVSLIFVYLAGLGVAYKYFNSCLKRSVRAFSATREEIAADIEMLRSKV